MNLFKSSLVAVAATFCLAGASSAATSVCLITKDATNPFFVKMAQGAFAKAAELGVELRSYAGKFEVIMKRRLRIEHASQQVQVVSCLLPLTQKLLFLVKQARDASR